jgi:hypothetical protein
MYHYNLDHLSPSLHPLHKLEANKSLCLTTIYNPAHFLVNTLTLSLDSWPEEFKMYGDRRTVAEVLQWAESVKGGKLLLKLRDIDSY